MCVGGWGERERENPRILHYEYFLSIENHPNFQRIKISTILLI